MTQEAIATPAETAPVAPIPSRDEFNYINVQLRRHNDGEAPLPPEEYVKLLRRSIEIMTTLNSAPIDTTKKTAAKKAAPASKVAHLKANPNSLDDL